MFQSTLVVKFILYYFIVNLLIPFRHNHKHIKAQEMHGNAHSMKSVLWNSPKTLFYNLEITVSISYEEIRQLVTICKNCV